MSRTNMNAIPSDRTLYIKYRQWDAVTGQFHEMVLNATRSQVTVEQITAEQHDGVLNQVTSTWSC